MPEPVGSSYGYASGLLRVVLDTLARATSGAVRHRCAQIYLFDLILWPQDTIYLVFLNGYRSLGLYSHLPLSLGRCVWLQLSQTVYTEIFLWLEKDRRGGAITAYQA